MDIKYCSLCDLTWFVSFATGKNQDAERDDRYWEVLENLKSHVKAKEQELAFLTAERKRLMNKNFPKLPELNQE